MRRLVFWAGRARRLEEDLYVLYQAWKDPRTPLPAKIIAACVVGYAFSPIDLIPDFVPFAGYLDDVILIPLGLAVARRMIPAAVLDDCRTRARAHVRRTRPKIRAAIAFVLVSWLLATALIVWLIVRALRD